MKPYYIRQTQEHTHRAFSQELGQLIENILYWDGIMFIHKQDRVAAPVRNCAM